MSGRQTETDREEEEGDKGEGGLSTTLKLLLLIQWEHFVFV